MPKELGETFCTVLLLVCVLGVAAHFFSTPAHDCGPSPARHWPGATPPGWPTPGVARRDVCSRLQCQRCHPPTPTPRLARHP